MAMTFILCMNCPTKAHQSNHQTPIVGDSINLTSRRAICIVRCSLDMPHLPQTLFQRLITQPNVAFHRHQQWDQ